MIVLVLNCGSSSIKYQLFNMTTETVMAKGMVDRIGIKGAYLKHEKQDGKKVTFEHDFPNHKFGIGKVLEVLTSADNGCIKSLNEIDAVGHRIVHGGEKFKSSVLLDDDIIESIKECTDLAPLHNPANLSGIYAIKELLPTVPQCAIFDTAFHQTMPDYAYMYALPYELYVKHSIRRYGFHGTSHYYISKRACEVLGVDIKTQKIITCHLGNGASVAAIKNGESVDTSMGLTPLEGLMMGTRSGDVDGGVITFLMDKENFDGAYINNMLNKKSGLTGISEGSSDMRDILRLAKEGNTLGTLALNMYAYRVRKYIGSYAAAMGGVDIVIFSGGIGENSEPVRKIICKDFEYMGMEVDPEKNIKAVGVDFDISKAGSKVKTMVIPTNEELVIAEDTMTIVSAAKK